MVLVIEALLLQNIAPMDRMQEQRHCVQTIACFSAIRLDGIGSRSPGLIPCLDVEVLLVFNLVSRHQSKTLSDKVATPIRPSSQR